MRKFLLNLPRHRFELLARYLLGDDAALSIESVIDYCKSYSLTVSDLKARFPDLN